jgi:hypothetical protein
MAAHDAIPNRYVQVVSLTTSNHPISSSQISGGAMGDRREFAGREERRRRVADRRGSTRLDKVFPVWLEGLRGGCFGVARNISEGGMFIETRDPLPLGSQVRVSFPAQWGEMTAVSEVRYVCHLLGRLADGAPARGPEHAAVRGMGVRFLYFDPDGDARGVVH